MNLQDAKRFFFDLRKKNRIDVVEEHVIKGHPEREYSVDEVVGLVRSSGTLEDTTEQRYRGLRFYWRTRDVERRSVRLVIEFDQDEVGQLILVISAGERV